MKGVRPVRRSGRADWQSYDDRVREAPEQDVDGQDGMKTRQLQDDKKKKKKREYSGKGCDNNQAVDAEL